MQAFPAVLVASLALYSPVLGEGPAEMTFFITSAGSGDGANLGGLEGADAICNRLATAAGSSGRTWRAYLSATGVNARDRIGSGPWVNVRGQLIAADIDTLHSYANRLAKHTSLTETGAKIKGRGDFPIEHHMLTGSNADGTLAAGKTCADWTSNGDGMAMVGHSDRLGRDGVGTATSWNAAHPTEGCSQEALRDGGKGLFMCFATD